MAVPLVRLPELQFPSNALLNFEPLNNALTERNRINELNIRNQIEENRFGRQHALERNRFGLEERRTGFEQERLRLQQEEANRQNQERESIRLGNTAFGIRNIADPVERRIRTERLLSNPGIRDLLTRNGITVTPSDELNVGGGHGAALDFLINQVQDARTRYAPQIVHGAPGTGFFEMQTGPSGTRLNPVARVPERTPPLSDTALDNLTTQGTNLSNLRRLTDTWSNDYTVPGWAGVVGMGDARNWAGRTFSNASANAQSAAQWWQDYQNSYELVRRHGMFGSALTATEMRAWQAANITPNMTPDAIRRNLAAQRQIAEAVAIRGARARLAQGQPVGPIAQALGIDPRVLTGEQPPTTTQPPPTTTTTPPPNQPPQPGTVIRGYRFRGGDPARAENWERVGG